MRNLYYLLFFVALSVSGCKSDTKRTTDKNVAVTNTITHANGLQIYRYDGYTVVKVTNPWPEAQQGFTYVMQKKGATVPDSLKQYTTVQIPLKTVVVTSTTHIPSLELFNAETTLTGFPGTDFISSEKTRVRIDSGKVKEAGANETLNTEVLIDLAPDAVVGFSISGTNKALATLEQSGLKVLYNGDWTEQTPLGKAEWIKFFGALYDQEDKADKLFADIEKQYNDALTLAQKATTKPTVLGGAMFQDQWYLPQGGSWAALFLKDAKSNYLWAGTEGTGSLTLSFETVLDKAQDADVWVGPGQFTTYKEMTDANPHYAQFKAFKTKNVYSYSSKKGATGGLLYFELAPTRPDLVLKDLIAILHPDLMPGYQLHFFEKLK